ncbi:MAG: phosphoglycerate dehydrogenase [Anaerolineaceae bacterium]|nr:phosphoglycerate dehydrogenase [Anaerolineaceae bacterium]
MENLTVLILTDLTPASLGLLEGETGITTRFAAPAQANLRDLLTGVQAVITRDDLRIDAALLESAPDLRVIGRMGVDISNIDLDAATNRGILVMNTPGTNAVAAGEYTIALMLALSRKLVAAHHSLLNGHWPPDKAQIQGMQLQGKVLGIIGLGRVGQVVAERCLAFGMTVLAYDPYIDETDIEDDRVLLVGMKELLHRSDIVTLHVPATDETRGMVDAGMIARMKRGVLLVNTAHSSVLDEAAAAQALESGHLGGVALDVYSPEAKPDSPLVGHDRVLHTPHIGDNTVEAAQNLSFQIVQQVIDALRGTDYRNVVNMPFLPGTDYEAIRPYLVLAEHMGILLNVLARRDIRQVEVEFRGEEVHGLVKPLVVALLKGLLLPLLGEQVNYINAPVLAAERGMRVMQTKGLETAHYTNLVSCKVTLEDGEAIIMAGTLLDHQVPHIIQINQYRMNFVPEGHLLILGSYDKPGVIGRVGTLMAQNNINIASWHTGRAHPGGQTLTVITLDYPIPDQVLEDLRQLDFVRHVRQLSIENITG